MKAFTFNMPAKIYFGAGVSTDLSELARRFNADKVMLVTDRVIGNTKGFAAIAEGLEKNGIQAIVYDDTSPEPPVEAVDRAADDEDERLSDGGCGGRWQRYRQR